MTLGNHEFNFGSAIFKGELGQATFPLLQANVADDLASYGLCRGGCPALRRKDSWPEGIKVAILGIGNHRVPNYELPSNIPGLTFSDPIAKAQELSTLLRPTNDVVIALTHIGFTENPASVEVDANVDTNLVATCHRAGCRHRRAQPHQPCHRLRRLQIPAEHRRRSGWKTCGRQPGLPLQQHPGRGGPWACAPWAAADMKSSARPGATSVSLWPRLKTLPSRPSSIRMWLQLATYNNTVIGQTTAPIDALQAFTQETNGANLQADAAVYELSDKNGIPVDFHLSGAMTN